MNRNVLYCETNFPRKKENSSLKDGFVDFHLNKESLSTTYTVFLCLYSINITLSFFRKKVQGLKCELCKFMLFKNG